MKIKQIEDKKQKENILTAIKHNDGYCPCKLEKTINTKCMCKEFREGPAGLCHCGLYIKIEE